MSAATIVPAVMLIGALASLTAGLLTWRSGGKRQVFSSLILTAVAASMLLPDGSGRQVAAMSIAGGLIFTVLMTTPRAAVWRMRVELILFTAAIAVIWALALFDLPEAITTAGLVLLAVLVVAAFGAMILRAAKERDAK